VCELLHVGGSSGTVAELLALQRAAYAVEAGLIGSDAIPPLHDTTETLVAAGLTWYGSRDATGLLGAVAVAAGPGLVDLDRLVVAPRAFRRGVGTALVRHVLDLAGPRRVEVSTGRDNTPARALYARLGFVETGEEEVVPGLWVTRYARAGAGGSGVAGGPAERA
jgi:ribosomal protein S18 acetylase RimI-like enzyme